MTTATAIAPITTGWLRNPQFDLIFIIGVVALAMTAGLTAHNHPEYFVPIFVADLWLLGYHHVVATYTRTAFDKKSFVEYKNITLYLPILVAITVTVCVLLIGSWIIASVYLYWQWFHYTRQSEGISKAYIGKNPNCAIGKPAWTRIAFYTVPVAGILNISARAPETFLFTPIRTIPVPQEIVWVANIIAVIAVTAWVIYHTIAALKGRLAVSYVLYMLSHFAIYTLAYIALAEINYGWLAINIWHNAQYILFVWLYNNKRFAGKVDTDAPLLSTLSQNNRFPLYILTCLTLSTAAYYLIEAFGVSYVGNSLEITGVAAAVIIYQTINFHHYIVDSRIWKLRKKAIRQNLELAG